MRHRRRERGAIALEYILIAALVAIALIASFVKFRGMLAEKTEAITDTAGSAIDDSIKMGTGGSGSS